MSVILLRQDGQEIVTWDWTAWLNDGVTLVSVTHSLPAPLTKISEQVDAQAGRSSVLIAGAMHAIRYLITAEAVLSNGERVHWRHPVLGWNSG